MKLTIISRVKKIMEDEFFTKIEEIEVQEIRWEENHVLFFIRKGYAHYEHLEDNQEILRLTD